MKKVILLFIVLAFVISTTTNVNAQSTDKVAVEKLVNTYFDALNASDASKVVSLFTTEGALFASGAPTAAGSEALKGTFQYVFNGFTYTLQVTIGEIVVQGNLAYVTSTSKGSFVIKANGQKVEDDFRELFVMQKVKGTWKIARYMYNKSK